MQIRILLPPWLLSIRIQLFTSMRIWVRLLIFDADPDPASSLAYISIRIRLSLQCGSESGFLILMRIRILLPNMVRVS
jgi:hypothetical protein